MMVTLTLYVGLRGGLMARSNVLLRPLRQTSFAPLTDMDEDVDNTIETERTRGSHGQHTTKDGRWIIES
jgi:hypothetical protein